METYIGQLLLVLILIMMSTTDQSDDTVSEQSCSPPDSKKCGECYPELGCFPSTAPWYSALRPFPEPFSPQKIDTKLYYYSRTSPQRFNITLWPDISLNGADFAHDRTTTAFIVHGFDSDGNETWLQDLKDAYLKRVDANVFLVDWGKGARDSNYFQVASNTRVVGAELTRFSKWLIGNQQLDVSTVHMMGHSLGAHICAYVGKAIHNISRITGFDPAQPGFELANKAVRIDKSDADFVDILHTNAEPLVPMLGFGLIRPHGHVDFYMNGGIHQPGCRSPKDAFKDLASKIIHLTGIKDLLHFSLNEISKWVSCAHGRSYIYFTDALNYTNCSMWGQKSNVLRRLIDAGTVGWLEPLFTSLEHCTPETCLPVGLDTPKYKARGAFSVITARHQPYCNVTNNLETNKILKHISDVIYSVKKNAGTVGWLEPLFTSLEHCTPETCLPVGLDTPKYKARGAFSVITARHQPYCNVTNNLETDKILKHISDLIYSVKRKVNNMEKGAEKGVKKLEAKMKKIAKGIKHTFHNIFHKHDSHD